MGTELNQLREAAERWKAWCDRGHPCPSEYTPGSRSGPIAMQLDSYTLATYAAEQLAGDGGGAWVRIDVAKTWPIGTAMVVQPAMFYDGKVKNLAVFVDGLTQETIDRVTNEEAICQRNGCGFGYWFHRLENMVATKDFIPLPTTPTT